MPCLSTFEVGAYTDRTLRHLNKVFCIFDRMLFTEHNSDLCACGKFILGNNLFQPQLHLLRFAQVKFVHVGGGGIWSFFK